jgi:hypothetical protein
MLYSFVEHFYLMRFQYLKYITTFADLGHQVVEHGLGHLPFTEKQVATPTGRGGAGFGPGRAAARPKIFTFIRDIYIFVN